MLADGFQWCLSDSKSPQISRTRLRILAVLSNVVIWIVSTRPPTSKSSRPFNNPLVIVQRNQLQLAQSLLSCSAAFSRARSRYLSFFSHSSRLILWSARTAKSTILQVPFFVDYYKVGSSGWDLVIRLYVNAS